jgi:hypothetical protein
LLLGLQLQMQMPPLDATGRPLARAISATGLSARNGQVHSIRELEAWLDRGPLALDGAR